MEELEEWGSPYYVVNKRSLSVDPGVPMLFQK